MSSAKVKVIAEKIVLIEHFLVLFVITCGYGTVCTCTCVCGLYGCAVAFLVTLIKECVFVNTGIQSCILRGRVTEALRLVRLTYPNLLEKNKELLFKLKCRQFVEMISGFDDLTEEVPHLSCHSEMGGSSAGTSPQSPTMLPLSPHNSDSDTSLICVGEVSVICRVWSHDL